MKKKTKIAIFVVSILCIAAVIILLFCIKNKNNVGETENSQNMTTEQTCIYALKTAYPTDFMFIGDAESLNFDESLEYRTLDKVNADTLKRDKKYKYSVIIINDLDGKMELSDDTLSAMQKCIVTDRGFYLMYLGKNFEKLEPMGIYSEDGPSQIRGVYLLVSFIFGSRTLEYGSTEDTSISAADIMLTLKISIENSQPQ